MKTLIFYNQFHNGDIFHNRNFIREISSKISNEIFYAHKNDPVLLSDLNVKYCEVPNVHEFTKFSETDDILYINTWIGCYFCTVPQYYGECSLRMFYEMYKEIYGYINSKLNTNLELSEISAYFPRIDYSKFSCENIDKFIEKYQQKKILFSNGPCHSGQSLYDGDMASLIEECADKHPNKIFIATHKFDTNKNNIKFTNDLINLNRNDLNEISYLSKFCDLIIGRNSGPYCFCTVHENVMNYEKTFYAFGQRETDCFYYMIETNAKFIFENTGLYHNIKETVHNLVLQME